MNNRQKNCQAGDLSDSVKLITQPDSSSDDYSFLG